MGNSIVMPQLGLTMTEGTVSKWFKNPGDKVEKDEIILAVATDKVDMDVEATIGGVIREIVVAEGEIVPVGTVLAYLEGAEKSIDRPASKSTEEPATERVVEQSEMTEKVNPEASEREEVVRASPRAKKKARELGIDLSTVHGSGPGGRIVEEDVLALEQSGPPAAIPVPSLQRRRQIIAQRMLESVRTIPAFSLTTEVNAEKLVALYRDMQEPVRTAAGSKLTYTDLLIKALGIAVSKSPTINSKWVDDTVHKRTEKRIAVAVATDAGVIAPVLKDPATLSLQEIVRLRATLTEKARSGKLTAENLEGDIVGTISNLGMYNVDNFEGLVTPGQTFILSVGRLRERPWAETTVTVKPTMALTLSVDHRIVDGAAAAVFLQSVIEVLTSPYQTLW